MTISHPTLPSCFYHPTTVIFLDDNKAFLDALELEFGAEERMLTFTEPTQALKAIDSNKNYSTYFLKTIDDSDISAGQLIGFDLTKMINIIYDKSRFEQIAVVCC